MLGEILSVRSNLVSTADFKRHRQSSGRKIQKLRKQNSLTQRPSRGKSPKPKKLATVKHAPIGVWQTERAWAAAMEARSALDASGASGLRRQSLAKLAKAHRFATSTATICHGDDAELNGDPQLEIETLKQLTLGDLWAAKNKWDVPKKAYSAARLGLEALAKRDPTWAPLFNDYIDSHVDPALKLALARTGGSDLDIASFARAEGKDTPLGKLAAAACPDVIKFDEVPPTETLGTIEWRGHKAKVRDADLSRQILNTRAKDAELQTEGYDNVLQSWADAGDLCRELLSRKGIDEGEQDLHVVSTYIEFSLLWRRIERDNELSLNESRPEIGARLLENILQSCDQLQELPGVYSDDELGQSIDAMKLYFKSRRAALIGQGYYQRESILKALALEQYALSQLSSEPILPNCVPIDQKTVDEWKNTLTQKLYKTYGAALLLAKSRPEFPVANDMNIFPAGQCGNVLDNIVDTQGVVQPIPVKPVFYDLAYNYINYPEAAGSNVASKAPTPQKEDTPEATEPKKSLFGFFKK